MPNDPLISASQPNKDNTPTDLITLHHMMAIQAERLETLSVAVKRFTDILDGDTSRDMPGLRARVKAAEEVTAEWGRYKLIIKGIAIGMGLTLVTSVSTLVTVISQVLSAGAKP